MTASTLSQLPMAAGSALLAGLGRASLWAVTRYMRAPLANTGMLALATMTAMAGTNALYNQSATHPAPLFAPGPVAPVPAERPEDLARLAEPLPGPSVPVEEPAPLVQPVTSETTGSVAPIVPDAPVGNKDVFAVQKKLFEMKLFEGEIDGYYGPMTARAIRAFEERNGMPPQGALTPAVIEAILDADATGALRTPAAQPAAASAALPATASDPDRTETAAAAPVAALTPAPAPLPAGSQPDVLIGPVQSGNPVDTVVATATETIDTLIAAVGDRQTPAPPAQKPMPALPLPTSPSSNTSAQAMPAPIARAQSPSIVPVRHQPAASATAEPSRQSVASASAQATRPTNTAPSTATTNRELVSQVQRGLASLGFLHGAIDGEADEATARAIRNFEVYHNYKVTGQVSPALVDMLLAAGASI